MSLCKNCKSTYNENDQTCNTCNYPLAGTEQEQASFIARQVILKADVKDSLDKLKSSRKILFTLGGFYMIAGFFIMIKQTIILEGLINIIFGSIFIGFGFLTFKAPKIALIMPLALITAYYTLILVTDPMLFVNGIIWKVIVLGGLSYGLISIIQADRILKSNPYIASVLGYNKI